MAVTSNLGLDIFDTASGSATTFLQYRLAVAGNDSNMTIIDNWAGDVSGSVVSLESNAVRNVSVSRITENYYEGTVDNITSYATNAMINLKLNTVNSGAVTININSIGVVALKKINVETGYADFSSGDLKPSRYYLFLYDGTHYVLMGSSMADQISLLGNINNIVSISGSGVLQDSGVSASSVTTGISGSSVMSDTTGSIVKHNESGVVAGSYNRFDVNGTGHVTSASLITYQTVSSIAGSAIMTNTTGSVVVHNVSGVASGSYTKVIVDAYGHVTSGSEVTGISGSLTFYSGSAVDALATILNTVTISQGLITSWTQT